MRPQAILLPAIIPMLLTPLAASPASASDATITVGSPGTATVSPHLTGMNTVYSHESMKTWKDGRKVMALKEARIGCLRYPGGHVVSFWDWEFPYHSPYQDFWHPEYIRALTPEKKAELRRQSSHRMSLDHFLAICADASLEPIVGINMFQGYKYDRLDDSIAKAVRLVEYCKKQQPRARYYFLDNEAGHQPTKGRHVPVADYIKLIPAYSKAIKAAQSDAQLIVNPIAWGRVEEVIKKTGRHFDIVDSHWYYSNRKWGLFYISDWRAEAGNQQFRKRMRQFDLWKRQSGHEHLKLGLLEWNLGPSKGSEGSDKSTALMQGLVQADMLMQFIQQDVFMAACWPLMWAPPGKEKSAGYRNFFEPNSAEPSPARYIFRWFGMAGDGKLIACDTPSSDGLHAICVLHKGGKKTLLYALNKSTEDRNVTVNFPEPVSVISARSFQRGVAAGSVEVKTLQTQTRGQTLTFHLRNTSLGFLELANEF